VKPFVWQARVYWEDTDAGGIVYYANYLRFMERARTEWLRSQGIWQGVLERDVGVIFAVVELQARYRLPARLDDLLMITCEAAREGAASIVFDQQVCRDRADGELLLSGSVRVACLDAASLRPRRLPPLVLQALTTDNS
jgi:acyl-CoA thioester hydrolase